MTQNDISYYHARKEAKDARLRRKETKRHNLASEAIDYIASQARMKSADASNLSAQAALQNAGVRQSEYELEYAKEYGAKPGGKTSDYEFVLYDPVNGTETGHITTQSGYAMPESSKGHPTILYVGGHTPMSYRDKVAKVANTMVESQKTGSVDTQKQIWDTIFTAGKTVNIVTDTTGSVIKITDSLKTND